MKNSYKFFSITLLVCTLFFSEVLKAYSYYFYPFEVFEMVEQNNVYGIERWLSTYPNLNIRNELGQTPFMLAIRLQHYTIANRLLVAGADQHMYDRFGRTARDYAYENSVSYQLVSPPSTDAGTVLAALGIVAIAGVAAYVLSDTVAHWSITYDGGYELSTYDRYCPGCGATRYAGQSLYCRGCCGYSY